MPPSTVPDYRIRTHPRPHDAESQSLALEGEGPHLWLKKATTDTERMDQKTAHSPDVAALHNQSQPTDHNMTNVDRALGYAAVSRLVRNRRPRLDPGHQPPR